MKLSKRLAAIDALITEPEDIIWDCCCDHGYLGLALLKRNAANKVIFVDIVPDLMANLELLLLRVSSAQSMHSNNDQWQVLCKDVGAIKLTSDTKQVVVIAGVGGELLLKLLQQVVANNSMHIIQNVRFILCPVQHTYTLRTGLDLLGLGLLSEQIIVDNKRFYEVIEVSFNSNTTLSKTGDMMWQYDNAVHKAYKQQLLNHYTKMLNKDALYYQKVITDYQGLIDS